MTEAQRKKPSDGYTLLVALGVLSMDVLGIWLGWNEFVTTVSDMPRIGWSAAFGAALMKSALLRSLRK